MERPGPLKVGFLVTLSLVMAYFVATTMRAESYIECEAQICVSYQKTLLGPAEAGPAFDLMEVDSIDVGSGTRRSGRKKRKVYYNVEVSGASARHVEVMWSFERQAMEVAAAALRDVRQSPGGRARITNSSVHGIPNTPLLMTAMFVVVALVLPFRARGFER